MKKPKWYQNYKKRWEAWSKTNQDKIETTLTVDLSKAKATTINELRKAFAVQVAHEKE